MAYTFDKHNFKKYLHRNCHRSWFSKQEDNARYKDSRGIRDVESYSDEYTVRVKEILRDPELNKNIARGGEIISSGQAAAAGIACAALAPFTLGGSLFAGAAAVGWGGVATLASEKKNKPEDVYFTITGDDSRWVAEDVVMGGIKDVAYKICKWSNEVHRERYEKRQSDEFQTYIEQRTPTPNY